MIRIPTEEEKRLWNIIEPFINHNNEPPLSKDAPPEIFQAFEKWKEISIRNDKEVIDWMLETEVTFNKQK